MYSLSIIAHLSYITAVVIHLICHLLKSSVRQLNMIVAMYISMSISFLLCSKVKVLLVIMYLVLVVVRTRIILLMISPSLYICSIRDCCGYQAQHYCTRLHVPLC